MIAAVLYSFRRCPYAMRGRMALFISGAEYEHREVLLRNKPAAMLAASPKGTVPVFVASNGRIIDESLDLMHWALERSDPQGWLSCDLNAAKALIDANDGPFKHHLDRYKYASRYKDDAARGDVELEHRAAAEEHIDKLETCLDGADYLLGDTQTIADIAVFPFIRQFANTDRTWWESAPYPHVREWLTRHTESALFKTVMQKHPVWIDPNGTAQSA